MDADIFGHMRFSYLGRSDARLTRSTDDLAQRIRLLYAPERMEERFHFFERLCAPSLRWQTDKGFRFVIFTSPEMPDCYKERLAAAVRDIPQVEVVYESEAPITQAVDAWVGRQDVARVKRTVHFRLDDDDVLATDFIATLRRHMDHVPDHAIISRPSGLLLIDSASGPELLAKFEAYIAIGFALVNPPNGGKSPYALGHRRYHRNVPSLSLPGPLAYIHTAHLHSDTAQDQHMKLAHARADHASLFGNRPRRFREAVERQFGGLSPQHFRNVMRTAPSRIAAAE